MDSNRSRGRKRKRKARANQSDVSNDASQSRRGRRSTRARRSSSISANVQRVQQHLDDEALAQRFAQAETDTSNRPEMSRTEDEDERIARELQEREWQEGEWSPGNRSEIVGQMGRRYRIGRGFAVCHRGGRGRGNHMMQYHERHEHFNNINNLGLVDRDFGEQDYEVLLALDELDTPTKAFRLGAGQGFIESLPITTFKKCDKELKEEKDNVCAVCLCEYEEGDKMKLMPCLHRFHPDCVDPWLKSNRDCPICKADVIDFAQQSGEY